MVRRMAGQTFPLRRRTVQALQAYTHVGVAQIAAFSAKAALDEIAVFAAMRVVAQMAFGFERLMHDRL